MPDNADRPLNPVVARVLREAEERRNRNPGKPRHGKRWGKARDEAVTIEYLLRRMRNYTASGYAEPKWVEFCRVMLRHGFDVRLYEARLTNSKYVTVSRCHRRFVVRFSDHKPNKNRELARDCDVFVGRTHTGTRNTEQAIEATLKFFNGGDR